MNNPLQLQSWEMPKRFFAQPQPELQHTWKSLVQLVLSAEGQESFDPSPQRLADYQSRQRGRSTGGTVLTELLPLPAPSTKQWLYDTLSNLPELRTRSLYYRLTAPRRTRELSALVNQYKPAGVVFYSIDKGYRPYWEAIAGVPFTTVSAGGIEVARRDGMVFMIIAHPVFYNGADYFLEAGRILALEIARQGKSPHIYSGLPASKIDRSFYRRFWKRLFADPRHQTTIFATKTPVTWGFISVPYSTKRLPTSFMYGLSIPGRWAVAQFNVPKVGRTPGRTAALSALITNLKTLNLVSALGPCTYDETQDALYVKHAYHCDVVDEQRPKDLHTQMVNAMIALNAALRPFI